MITFDDFKADGKLPVYQQILDYIKRGAVAGTIADGDELPSRRVLSARLGINPNTVQKAFALLPVASAAKNPALLARLFWP